MKIIVNSQPHEVQSRALSDALTELGFLSPAIATALNGTFVPRNSRESTQLAAGDRLEVLSPMQGG
ncbi:thiamine biosynthesis protein ThiS [Roseobacter cerasinus]|uniref:Thiamine biosynthesis protein ThiS n=1 Tax=Roseobacter cerasinus TaxID=2602289 RepID=A0A640VW27_9RHOB|nr:sulfur carrier protein ThiS [Roseobacter cerasinus]GFE51600.1 thiamine biosynthesis protein ThiS [Roseobacter cerasinus]